MRFIAQRQDLFQLLTKLQTVVGQKAALPILSNILLEAKGNLLTVTGTDLVIGLKAFLEAKVFEEGATTLPARRLTQLLRELTCHAVEITKGKEEIVEVTANSSRFKIHALPAAEYPLSQTFKQLKSSRWMPKASANVCIKQLLLSLRKIAVMY